MTDEQWLNRATRLTYFDISSARLRRWLHDPGTSLRARKMIYAILLERKRRTK